MMNLPAANSGLPPTISNLSANDRFTSVSKNFVDLVPMHDAQFLSELIAAANAAPLADNNQPWKFEPTPNGLNVYWDVSRRLPSDVDGMFDLLSIGAAVENLFQKLASVGRTGEIRFIHPSTAEKTEESLELRHVACISVSDKSLDIEELGLSKIYCKTGKRLDSRSRPNQSIHRALKNFGRGNPKGRDRTNVGDQSDENSPGCSFSCAIGQFAFQVSSVSRRITTTT